MLVVLLFTLDIPNLVNVELPGAFSYVMYKSIKSNVILLLLCVDVSPLLADLVQVSEY